MTVVREVVAQALERRPRNWRKGQTVFNALAVNFPEAAEPLRGSPIDCFHDDGKIEEFVAAVEKNLEVLP